MARVACHDSRGLHVRRCEDMEGIAERDMVRVGVTMAHEASVPLSTDITTLGSYLGTYLAAGAVRPTNGPRTVWPD